MLSILAAVAGGVPPPKAALSLSFPRPLPPLLLKLHNRDLAMPASDATVIVLVAAGIVGPAAAPWASPAYRATTGGASAPGIPATATTAGATTFNGASTSTAESALTGLCCRFISLTALTAVSRG